MYQLWVQYIALGRIPTFLGLKEILITFLKIRSAELANVGHILAKILRSIEQFVRIAKGHNSFW